METSRNKLLHPGHFPAGDRVRSSGTPRRQIYLPEPELWEDVERAALAASVERGSRISVSEWVREAIREKLFRWP